MKSFILISLLFPSLVFAAASQKELIQRVYGVEGHPDELIVLREVREWRDKTSLDGLRLFQLYRDGTLVDFRLERFGQAERNRGEGLEYVIAIDTEQAKSLSESMIQLFAEAITKERQPRLDEAGVLDLQGRPTGQLEYYYRSSPSASSSAVDSSLRSGADDWRRRSEDILRQKEFEREARRRAVQDQGQSRIRLEENFRDLTAKTAVSALAALERTAKEFQDLGFENSQKLIEKERYLNPLAQARERDDVERLAKNAQWAEVARRVADFESPNSRFPSPETVSWLKSSQAVRQLRDHPYFNRQAMPRFRDSSLEAQKLVIANLMQAASLNSSARTQGAGGLWLRSSALLVEAAAMAEKAGRPQRARDLLAQARTISSYFAGGSEGRSLRIVNDGRGRKTFVSDDHGPSMSKTVADSTQDLWAATIDTLLTESGDTSTEPTFLETDTPSARNLGLLFHALRKSLGKSTDFSLRAGSVFLSYAEKAQTQQDLEVLTSMVVLSIDLFVGFVPPVAVVKGLYEFSTGRHLLTNKELNSIDRGFALLSAMTFGTSQLALKGAQAIGRLAPFSHEARLAFSMAEEMGAALRSSGGRFASSMIESYRKALPSVVTTEEAVRLVRAQALVTAGRLEKMPVAAQAWSLSGPRNSVLEARALRDSQKLALVALPGVLYGHRVIVEASQVHQLTWEEIRRKYDLPAGPAPRSLPRVVIREGDFFTSTTTSSGEERILLKGVETDRNFGPERSLQWDDEGRLKP